VTSSTDDHAERERAIIAIPAKECYNATCQGAPHRAMSKKARTPIVEYEDHLAIELKGEGPPRERDRLTDQAMVVAYDRLPGRRPRWRLRALLFDREEWTRSAIRRWWAAHEIWFLPGDRLDQPTPEVCRSYDAPSANLPTILLCHRNTPLVPASRQIQALRSGKKTTTHPRH
jgi:hypothetical protein